MLIDTIIQEEVQRNPTSNYGLVYSLYGYYYYVRPIIENQCDFGSSVTLMLSMLHRKQHKQVCVGDIVEYNPSNNIISSVLNRRSILDKPQVANVDQAVVLVASEQPQPDWLHLDYLLCQSAITLPSDTIICFSKADLSVSYKDISQYQSLGYTVLLISNFDEASISEMVPFLKGKTNIVAGKSGVGKSTLLNQLCPDLQLSTNVLSSKTQQGQHTTRATTLYNTTTNGYEYYILDTPGFSNPRVQFTRQQVLDSGAFPEIRDNKCLYASCHHQEEEGCTVQWSDRRYRSYIQIMKEAEEWENKQRINDKIKSQKDTNKSVSRKTIPLLDSNYRSRSRKFYKQKQDYLDNE